MGVNGVPIFYIEKSLFLGAINHCFDNKSQTDPSPWANLCFDFLKSATGLRTTVPLITKLAVS